MEREKPTKHPNRDGGAAVKIDILLKDTLKVMEDNHMMIEMFGGTIKRLSSLDFMSISDIGFLNESFNKIMDMRTFSLDTM